MNLTRFHLAVIAVCMLLGKCFWAVVAFLIPCFELCSDQVSICSVEAVFDNKVTVVLCKLVVVLIRI